jgi:hypothetical protein
MISLVEIDRFRAYSSRRVNVAFECGKTSGFGNFPQGKAEEALGRLQKTLGKWTKSGK